MSFSGKPYISLLLKMDVGERAPCLFISKTYIRVSFSSVISIAVAAIIRIAKIPKHIPNLSL